MSCATTPAASLHLLRSPVHRYGMSPYAARAPLRRIAGSKLLVDEAVIPWPAPLLAGHEENNHLVVNHCCAGCSQTVLPACRYLGGLSLQAGAVLGLAAAVFVVAKACSSLVGGKQASASETAGTAPEVPRPPKLSEQGSLMQPMSPATGQLATQHAAERLVATSTAELCTAADTPSLPGSPADVAAEHAPDSLDAATAAGNVDVPESPTTAAGEESGSRETSHSDSASGDASQALIGNTTDSLASSEHAPSPAGHATYAASQNGARAADDISKASSNGAYPSPPQMPSTGAASSSSSEGPGGPPEVQGDAASGTTPEELATSSMLTALTQNAGGCAFYTCMMSSVGFAVVDMHASHICRLGLAFITHQAADTTAPCLDLASTKSLGRVCHCSRV